MATKHTEHYQLNLWEPNDKFVRTEFNENSGKIDAALHQLEQTKAAVSTTTALQETLTEHNQRMNELAIKPAYTYLRTFTTTGDSTKIDLAVSDIDWSKWEQVVIKTHLRASGVVRMSPNGESRGSYTVSNVANTDVSGGVNSISMTVTEIDGTITLLPGRKPNKWFESFFWGNGVFQYGHHLGVKFSEVNILRFLTSTNGVFYSGTTFEFWGIG